jgi:hypothetical protein
MILRATPAPLNAQLPVPWVENEMEQMEKDERSFTPKACPG